MKGKGVIMELRPKTMVIMTNQCGFEEIKRCNNCSAGMEIEYDLKDTIKRKKTYFKPLIAIAAALMLLVVSSLYFMGNTTPELTSPVALLTIDINPSILLEVDENQRVTKVMALNEEAEGLSLDALKNQEAKIVVDEIIKVAEEMGYLVEVEENYVLLTTVFLIEEVDEQLRRLPEELKKTAEESAIKRSGNLVKIVTIESNYDTYLKAQEEKTSVGKLELYQRLEANETEITSEDIRSKNVKELIKRVEKKAHPVFEIHPSEKEGKQHPVFETHPGNKDKKQSPVFETQPNKKEEKQHPVFETHPGNKDEKQQPTSETQPSKKEEKQHPVFETHPSNNEQKKHPVFENFPQLDKKLRSNPVEKNKMVKPQEKKNS